MSAGTCARTARASGASVQSRRFARPDGALLGFGKIVADRTDLKTLQDTLQSRNDDLARADELKNRFLATLAHELRNPQAVLANSAGVLRRLRALSDGQLQAIADMIERQVRQTQRLIEDLSDLVRTQPRPHRVAHAAAGSARDGAPRC